jgi:hypothetical protein
MIAFCNVQTARQVANELSRLIRMSGGR